LVTVAFTPGSLSLSCYALTPKGFEWARSADAASPNGYNPSAMSERAQLLLSDRILGSCFCPTGETWNYSVGLGSHFTGDMPYTMNLTGSPIGYWDAAHRPNHFAQFVAAEGADLETDQQDAFA